MVCDYKYILKTQSIRTPKQKPKPEKRINRFREGRELLQQPPRLDCLRFNGEVLDKTVYRLISFVIDLV